MREIYICKIPLEDIPKESITVFSQWDDSSFSLKIIHCGNAWEKDISSESVKSMSSYTQYNPAEYILETKRALTTNEGVKDFIYSLAEPEFTWKKLVDRDENIRVKYGSVLLEKAAISSVTDKIIDFMILQRNSTEERKKELEKENSRLKMVNSNLRAQVDNLVSSKNEMEETLYSKFTCLLNAKKEKILKLEKSIQEYEKSKKIKNTEGTKDIEKDPYGSETEIESEEENRYPVAAKNVTRDEYGSETEIDTDEEGMGPSSSKIKKLGSPVLLPQNYNLEDVSDESVSHSDSKKEGNENFQKDLLKNPLESFLKDSPDSGDKKHSDLLSAERQKFDYTVGESSKLRQIEASTSNESKSNLGSSQHDYGKFNIEDLLEDM